MPPIWTKMAPTEQEVHQLNYSKSAPKGRAQSISYSKGGKIEWERAAANSSPHEFLTWKEN